MAASTTTSREIVDKLLDTEKLKNCFECGICTASCSIAELLGPEYSPRRLLGDICSSPEEVLSSNAIWACAWCYACHNRCPQSLNLPEIFLSLRTEAVSRGMAERGCLDQVLQKIVKNVPLPLIAALVCFHLERAGLKTEEILQQIEQIREESMKTRKKEKSQKPAKERIAVIGSGPSGLAVAYELGRRGYRVTVFEALGQLGGMLRKGIPGTRLPKHVIDKEVKFIENFEVEFKTGVRIGKDLCFDDFKKELYKAVFVGAGAHRSRKLKIEGTNLKGVLDALDFLWGVNVGQKAEPGNKVVVIGGGNVAVDAARTALCLGTKDVTILYRRSKEEMPANKREVDEAEREGVKIEFLASPKKIRGENDQVCGIECVRMQLGEPDDTGRRIAVPVEGSEFKYETDRVILAIGEMPDLEFLPKDVELNEDGTLWVNPITMETTVQGVFGGGDAVSGPASVIEAIRDGKRAAESIEEYLKSRKEGQNDE